MAIQLVTGKVVDTDTLILFDELQEAPRGLTAMKYFRRKRHSIMLLQLVLYWASLCIKMTLSRWEKSIL